MKTINNMPIAIAVTAVLAGSAAGALAGDIKAGGYPFTEMNTEFQITGDFK